MRHRHAHEGVLFLSWSLCQVSSIGRFFIPWLLWWFQGQPEVMSARVHEVNQRTTRVLRGVMSIIFIVLNNQLAKYAKFHMTYNHDNDPALVLKITPLKGK